MIFNLHENSKYFNEKKYIWNIRPFSLVCHAINDFSTFRAFFFKFPTRLSNEIFFKTGTYAERIPGPNNSVPRTVTCPHCAKMNYVTSRRKSKGSNKTSNKQFGHFKKCSAWKFKYIPPISIDVWLVNKSFEIGPDQCGEAFRFVRWESGKSDQEHVQKSPSECLGSVRDDFISRNVK